MWQERKIQGEERGKEVAEDIRYKRERGELTRQRKGGE